MILETKRLWLRHWEEGDAEECYRYAKDPAVGPAAGWAVHTSVEDSCEVIRKYLSGKETYALVLKETGLPIGSIGLHFHSDLAKEEDEAELGYWIGVPYWGQGLVPEAAREMLRHAFEDLGLQRIWCGYYDGNEKSRRVQEKLGFEHQWITEEVPVPQMGEVRKGHANLLTKETWLKMSRKEMLGSFYDQAEEDTRLRRSRHGQLEYFTTIHYIHRFIQNDAKVLEVGAGTGRYSIALAREGMDVTAFELVESNLAVLKENGRGLDNLQALQGDATNLSAFADNSFDAVLHFGPMYHLYDPLEVNKAIDEAIRVTKPGGVIFYAFLSVFGIMYANYFSGNWASGQTENFTEDYQVRHFKEQLFTGYDIEEFEQLFAHKPVEWITTAGVDGMVESLENNPGFLIAEEDFEAFARWYVHFSEKRELLGSTNHLLYICRKE